MFHRPAQSPDLSETSMSPFLIIFQRISSMIYSPFLNLGMTRSATKLVRKLSHAHPHGYQCTEKVRPRSILHATRSTTNHGETCLFLKAHYTARVILLPDYDITEVLAVCILRQPLLNYSWLYCIARVPTSCVRSSSMNLQTSSNVHLSAIYAAQVVIVGDMNVHMDDVDRINLHNEHKQHSGRLGSRTALHWSDSRGRSHTRRLYYNPSIDAGTSYVDLPVLSGHSIVSGTMELPRQILQSAADDVERISTKKHSCRTCQCLIFSRNQIQISTAYVFVLYDVTLKQ